MMNANLLNPRHSVVLLAGIHPFLSPETARLGVRPLDTSRPAALPPARQAASAIAAGLRRVGLAVWHTLELAGQRRAAREFGLLADQLASTHPEAASNLRAQLARWRQG
jgi:hypothetical protein